jgi:hypothetical protein
MLQNQHKNQAPAYYYNEHLLTVEYSFSQYVSTNNWVPSSKLWLDILFMHPQTNEAVTIRVAKSTMLLCQSKEVIESLVHREIRQFLQQSQVKEYGMAHVAPNAGLAFC